MIDKPEIDDASIQFDQNYNYTSGTSQSPTNVSLIKELSANQSIVELALHKLASLFLVGVTDYE